MLHADDRTICSTCHVHAITSTPTAMIMVLITCQSRRCTWCWQCLPILTVNACRYWMLLVSRWNLALFWYSNVFEWYRPVEMDQGSTIIYNPFCRWLMCIDWSRCHDQPRNVFGINHSRNLHVWPSFALRGCCLKIHDSDDTLPKN